MKKLSCVLLILLSFLALASLTGCNASGGDDNNTNYTNPLPPPTPGDIDGDTVPDGSDCAPNNGLLWQLIVIYLDGDGDNRPDNGQGVIECVGLPNTYPGWTAVPPPPLDPCLNDAANTCNTVRPYLKISFLFSSGQYVWTTYGKCFPPPDPPDNFPEMGEGLGNNGVVVGDFSPQALTDTYCDFAITFTPPINNKCGNPVNWTPYQCNGQLYSGFSEILSTMEVEISPTGFASDEYDLPYTWIDNGQGGGNYRIGLSTSADGDVNVIASLRIDDDGDGLLNPDDNCMRVENPGQEANPGNLIGANGLRVGNACQNLDTDNDGTWDWLDPDPDNPNIF
jgi:hypothetical protein